MPAKTLYDGRDPRDLPAYGIGEAARYLRVPAATVRSWVAGRTYPRQDGVASFEPLIRPADPAGPRLSFNNLVEAHVLRALRVDHGVPIRAVRPAIDFAERTLGIERLLLSDQLLTGAREVFLEHVGTLINLTRSGQLVLQIMLDTHLRRVERDDRQLPVRLYPFLTRETGPQRSVVIDPRVSFGRPTLTGYGVRTDVIVQRINAGESVEELAADYEIPAERIEEAVLFQAAA